MIIEQIINNNYDRLAKVWCNIIIIRPGKVCFNQFQLFSGSQGGIRSHCSYRDQLLITTWKGKSSNWHKIVNPWTLSEHEKQIEATQQSSSCREIQDLKEVRLHSNNDDQKIGSLLFICSRKGRENRQEGIRKRVWSKGSMSRLRNPRAQSRRV